LDEGRRNERPIWEKSMQRVTFIVGACLGAIVFVAAASAADDLAQAVKERRELMDDVVRPAAKLGGDMIKGTIPFDGAKAAAAMLRISDVPETYVTLFPAGSEVDAVPDSEASPKIWEDFEGFKALAQKLEDASTAAAEAAEQGEGPFKAAFGDMTKVCKECHKAFRVKKD
jgi:cytochrome c556